MNYLFNRVMGISISKKWGIVALWGLYVIGVVVTLLLITQTAYGPVHQDDENRYWNVAYELYKGTFTLFENHYLPVGYPLSILPAFYLFYPNGTYVAVKFLNVLYFTSAIFPCYLILRKFTGRGLSLLVCAIIMINPAQVIFPRSILSENVFYPLFMWTILFAYSNFFSAGNKLRYMEDVIFGLLLGFLILTRYIALPIAPAMLLIWWIKPHEGEKMPFLISSRKIRRFLFVLVPLIIILGTWIYLGNREGLTIGQVLGFSIASDPNPLQLTRSRLFMWTIFYLSYTILMAAPFIGTLLISILYIRCKNWQDDLPRWIIAIVLIVICVLIACIRHSWRAAYNFPDPVKLQGRYLFYLGPLFLISTIAAIKKIKLPNLHSSDSGYFLYSIISIGLVVLAYSILYQGFLFLGQPLNVSPSSPDGYLIESLNEGFVLTCILCIMVTAWFMGRNQKLLLVSFLTLLSLLFLIGDMKIYHEKLLPRQYDNVQAYYLLKATQLDNHGLWVPETTPIVVQVKPGEAGQYVSWISALRVYGYRDIWIEEDLRLEGKSNTSIFVQVAGHEYKINEAKKDYYLSCNCEKYTFMGLYFTIQSTLREKKSDTFDSNLLVKMK